MNDMSTKILSAVVVFACVFPLSVSALTAEEAAAQTQALLLQVQQLQQQLGANQQPTAAPAQTTNPTGAIACVSLGGTLRLGSRGSDVSRLQQFLVSANLLSGDSVTGYFGPLTQAAVQKWQASHSIVSSGSPDTTGWGVVGPKTRAAITACGGAPVGAMITATPVAGGVPLSVAVDTIVNTGRSCNAATYVLDYGDKTEQTIITVPVGACGEVRQVYNHVYDRAGVYAVSIGAGGHKSTVTITAGSQGPVQQTVLPTDLPTSVALKVPGTIKLVLGQSAVSGTFTLRLDAIQVGTDGNGNAVATGVQVTATDNGVKYQPSIFPGTATQIGNYLVTITAITTNSATFSVAPYNAAGSGSSTGLTITPGYNGNLSAISVQFGLASQCTRYELSWGDTTTNATQSQGTCAAGDVQISLSHTYTASGNYTITLKRGSDLKQTDTGTVTVSVN